MIVAKDLMNEILDRLGWSQIETIEDPAITPRNRKLLRVMNRVLKVVGTFNDWPILRKSSAIILVASEESDTTSGSEQYVTATQNSDTITVANITFDDTYIGRAIAFSGSNYVRRIVAVPAPTQLQLDRIWIDDSVTVTDEVTFTIAADRYALPDDFDRLSGNGSNAFTPLKITPISPYEFQQKRYADAGMVVDDPTFLTVYDTNTGESNQLVHFHPYPKNARILSYDYQREHPDITSNNDKVLYAGSAITLIIDATLEIANGDLEADETKVARVIERLMRMYNQRQSNLGPTAPKFELRPANDIRISFHRAGIRTRIDWGEYWDRAEEPLK